ncbi:MAG: DUF305 domain-containing protein [Phycisphaerales bacterium]
MSNKWMAVIGAVVVLLVGGAIGWTIGANTGGDHMMDGDSMAMMDGVTETHHGMMAMDQKEFLAMMVAHHQMAVDMAEAEIAAGKDAKVKALARRVITAQQAEITQMRSWYRALYGEDVPKYDAGDHGMAGMRGMSGMTAEAVSGAANPDQAFLRMMIPHHAGAIMMADMVLNGTPNADVKTLAEVSLQGVRTDGHEAACREHLSPLE